MPGTYDVKVPTLHAGAGWLADDAAAVVAACSTGVQAATSAAGAVNGGPLGAASRRLSGAIAGAGDTSRSALDAGASTLRANADRYTSDDASAAGRLGAVDFGGGLR